MPGQESHLPQSISTKASPTTPPPPLLPTSPVLNTLRPLQSLHIPIVPLLHSEIPIWFPFFQERPLKFRDDVFTVARYRNLFYMDEVGASLATWDPKIFG
ncbi:hypothetical protein ACH5RR_037043 [Cinchona calisaya]|uniref:Uncharacterized protein n=1 Tax=Cinchona calisaya TaxID=153742 RepID=A0ABD2Y9E6_9GENT